MVHNCWHLFVDPIHNCEYKELQNVWGHIEHKPQEAVERHQLEIDEKGSTNG